jgi:hypothetical protein
MQRISIKQLEAQCEHLTRLTDSPLEPYTRKDGKFTANIGNYHLSQAYGGVELHRMATDGGGASTPAWHGYVPKREAHERLGAFINGIYAAKA